MAVVVVALLDVVLLLLLLFGIVLTVHCSRFCCLSFSSLSTSSLLQQLLLLLSLSPVARTPPSRRGAVRASLGARSHVRPPTRGTLGVAGGMFHPPTAAEQVYDADSDDEDADGAAPLPEIVVLPGDPIYAPETNTLRGHGTLVLPSDGHGGSRADGGGDDDGDDIDFFRASVAGTVDRINKLVTVRPLRGRYVPEIGDVVVGRVVELAPRRWKVDVNARQDASLLLSAVNLPGGVQRRRTYEDELNMRLFYEEHDLLSAEVQEVKADGAIMLQTRAAGRYGRLRSAGFFVSVTPALVRRASRHFVALDYGGLSAVLGVNGYIWVYREASAAARAQDADDDGAEGAEEAEAEVEDEEEERQPHRMAWNDGYGRGDEAAAAEDVEKAGHAGVARRHHRRRGRHRNMPSEATARALCRARNVVIALDALFLSITAENITLGCALSADLAPERVLETEFLAILRSNLLR